MNSAILSAQHVSGECVWRVLWRRCVLFRGSSSAPGSLFDQAGGRKFVSSGERHRLLASLHRVRSEVRLFCLMPHWSGARISEALAEITVIISIVCQHSAGTSHFHDFRT